MSFTEYLEIEAVNWSTLKEMRRSALHYRHRVTVPREDTASLRAGRIAHTAVFEPERFATDYALFDHENKGGKVVRNGNVWEEFKKANAHKTIITPAEHAKAMALSAAVRAHPLASPYLQRGHAEKTIQWTDPETGLRCKGRIDFDSSSKRAIVDLKSSASIAYGPFASTSYRLGYHCQLGFYQWGYKEATGEDLPVVVIPVEASAPHDVTAFEYSQDCLDTGREEARSLLVKLAHHREKNTWPGQYAEELVLEFPAWVDADDNEDISDLGLEDNRATGT